MCAWYGRQPVDSSVDQHDYRGACWGLFDVNDLITADHAPATKRQNAGDHLVCKVETGDLGEPAGCMLASAGGSRVRFTETIGDSRGVGLWPMADHSLTTNARVLAVTAGYRVIVSSPGSPTSRYVLVLLDSG